MGVFITKWNTETQTGFSICFLHHTGTLIILMVNAVVKHWKMPNTDWLNVPGELLKSYMKNIMMEVKKKYQ